MTRKLERVEELEIVQMYVEDVPVQEIEAELAVSKTVIYRILRDEGIQLRAHQNIGRPSTLDQMSEADLEAFILDYRSDMTVADMQTKWRIRSTTTIYELLRLVQEPLRQADPSHLQARQARLDHAVTMYRQGYFIWEIVAETGLGQPELHKELHKREVPLRRGSPERGKIGK